MDVHAVLASTLNGIGNADLVRRPTMGAPLLR